MDTVKQILKTIGYSSVEELGEFEQYTIEREVFEDLTLSKPGSDCLSVMHTYTQQSDLIRDPEIIFDVSGDEWTPILYQDDSVGILEEDTEGLEDECGHFTDDGSLSQFIEQWDENLEKQGFIDAAEDINRKKQSK